MLRKKSKKWPNNSYKKYMKKNLAKEVNDLCKENNKTLSREIEEDPPKNE